MGAMHTSRQWYFAEGYTGEGFEEWLCMQNPGDTNAHVQISYVNTEGVPIDKEVMIEARARRTVFVNQDVGADQQVSVTLQADTAIVAERPIYFNYHDWVRGGDVGSGVNTPSSVWYFTEGHTGDGFDEWVSLLNPQPQSVGVVVLFFLPDGEVTREEYTVPASTRTTYNVNQLVYTEGDVSVYILASQPVVAERPMYFRYTDKWGGGSLDTGYFPGVR